MYAVPPSLDGDHTGDHLVLSVDIGVQHMGLSMIATKGDYSDPRVLDVELVNLLGLDKNLTPFDTNHFADHIARMLKKYARLFECATKILIEGQPLTGLYAAEQILLFSHREKAIVIMPVVMHSYYNLARKSNFRTGDEEAEQGEGTEGGDSADDTGRARRLTEEVYNQRKREIEGISCKYMVLYGSKFALRKFIQLERKHDVGDSLCYGMMYIERGGRSDPLTDREQVRLFLNDMETESSSPSGAKRKRCMLKRKRVSRFLMRPLTPESPTVTGRRIRCKTSNSYLG